MDALDCTPVAARASLPGLGIIRARGADAASFLHGQLTQDIQNLSGSEARLAAFLNVKGRMMASFVVWRPADDEVLLACSADLLAPTLKRLSMFVLRAKCRLDDASAEWALQGLWAPATDGASLLAAGLPGRIGSRVALDGGGSALRLPSAADAGLWLLALPRPAATPDAPSATGVSWPASLAPVHALTEVGDEAFRLQCIRAGLPWIAAATTEQFVPQMVNFELIGGVHFQKGCYPGQEVVARSQYRGTLKRRAQRFTVGEPARAAQEIFHSADPGQPAGLVVLVAASPQADRWEVLAEVKLASLSEGSLHLGSPDGPLLEPAGLPYPVMAPGDDAARASAA